MAFPPPKQKKKPPPRPPPPNFLKYKSKSTYNLNQQSQSTNLIEWSPPSSPKDNRARHFGGSVSSSFSSSTSSLASVKKEFEPPLTSHIWPIQPQPTIIPKGKPESSFKHYLSADNQSAKNSNRNLNVPSGFGPTIIRPKVKSISPIKDLSQVSPPMPNIPPPSPPKEVSNVEIPYGIALYDYPGSHASDLALQTGDVVVLLRRINNEWLYGKIIEKEGMFPENFVDIQVPLTGEENIVTALYDFPAQAQGDLDLKAGQKIRVSKKVSKDWLFGECDGRTGQFPSNFVNRVPSNL